MNQRGFLILALAALLLQSCRESATEPEADVVVAGARWYSAEQVRQGEQVFGDNCAVCHGPEAQGTVDDWRRRLDDGSLPPPPLNGTAHAWHHPTAVLLQVIDTGGEPYGGKMPSFAAALSEPEKLAAIAYFQQFWSDEIYAQWEQMGGNN